MCLIRVTVCCQPGFTQTFKSNLKNNNILPHPASPIHQQTGGLCVFKFTGLLMLLLPFSDVCGVFIFVNLCLFNSTPASVEIVEFWDASLEGHNFYHHSATL